MSFKLSVITPAGQAFEGEVTSVAAPGVLGGFEVYSGHACMVAALKPGKFLIRTASGVSTLAVSDGILEVSPGHSVLVLADRAVPEQ